MAEQLAIDEIVVVDRHRQNLGNLKSLADSIRESGLLHPIVVTTDRRLVAGHRRLEACRLLGMDEVPVRVVSNLTTARSLLFAERDENTCRLDMTPSEKVALGLTLEELERPKAQERMTLGKTSPGSGRVKDLVGAAVGMSPPTYMRAKSVVVAATQGTSLNGVTLPAEVRAVAQTALAEMDRTGKVTPSYDTIDRAKRKAGIEPRHNGTQPKPGPVGRHEIHRKGRRINPYRIIDETISMLEGIALGLALIEDVKSLDAEKRPVWLEGLREPLAAINRFHKELHG